MQKKSRVFLILGILLLSLIPFAVAADSAPPPAEVWFLFHSYPSQPIQIIRAKVIACDIPNCNEKLAKYVSDPLHCTDNLCQWSYDVENLDMNLFGVIGGQTFYSQLIVEMQDGKKVSDIQNDFPTAFGEDASYQVMVNKNSLTLQRMPEFSKLGLEFNLGSYLFSLMIESLVGALFLAIWKKPHIVEVFKYGGAILLANLVTYPVIWSFFSSITQFHNQSQRTSGIIGLVLGTIFYILLITAANINWKVPRILAMVLSIPFCVFTFASFLPWLSGPGTQALDPMVTGGISSKVAVIMLEICTAPVEAFILYGLRKKYLKLSQTFLTSLVMNLASFLLGLLIFKPF